jgi:hypothetical protein
MRHARRLADRIGTEGACPGIAHVPEAQVQADGRGLVDDEQALTVGIIEDLFGVGGSGLS